MLKIYNLKGQAATLAAVLIGLLTGAFVFVILDSDFADAAAKLFGTTNKKETLEFLGWIIGGVTAFCGLFAFIRRVAVQAETNKLTEKGLSQERFKTAVEHMADDKESLRIASFYELFHLARDNKGDYGQTVLNILCAHLRQITRYEDAPKHEEYDHSEEVKTLFGILFGRETGYVFDDLRVDLKRANLSGFDFHKTNPKDIDFSFAILSEATFYDCNLSGCGFRYAFLVKTRFFGTNLCNVDLEETDLSCANFKETDLSGANFWLTDLDYASFDNVNFQDVKFLFVNFCNTNLEGADFLETADISGKYNDITKFPEGFDPKKYYGLEYVPPGTIPSKCPF